MVVAKCQISDAGVGDAQLIVKAQPRLCTPVDIC
jgi:hypothetical protein